MKRILGALLFYMLLLGAYQSAQAQSCDNCDASSGNLTLKRSLSYLAPIRGVGSSDCEACDSNPACDAICTCDSDSQCGFMGTVFVDALFFDRDSPDNLGGTGLASTSDGSRVLDTGQLDPSANVGYRIGAFLRPSNLGIFELAYLHNEWDVGRGVSSPNNLNAIPGTVDFTLADHIHADYDSEIDSFEVNRWGQLGNRFFWMFGARHLSLDERFILSGFDSGFRSDASITTDNSLYGLQIGGRHQSCTAGERMIFNLSGKFGLYENRTKQRTRLNDVDNTIRLFDIANEDSATSFVGDIEASLSLRLSQNLYGRLGYQVLWINDVALAPEQFQPSASLTSVSVDNDGDVVMHGAYAGMEFHW